MYVLALRTGKLAFVISSFDKESEFWPNGLQMSTPKQGIIWYTEQGASEDPCSDSYCGPSPFSESEVKGVADFLNAIPGRFRAYIDFHSFSQLWMTPWGYTKDLPPDFPVQVYLL